MTDPPNDRSPLALAVAQSTRVTAIALEMVIPGLIGLWIDWRLGTVAVFLGLGMALGMAAGILHLIHLGTEYQRDRTPDEKLPGNDAQSSARE